MIQFFGLHLGRESASVAVLGRDLATWARSRAAMVNVIEDPATGIAEVPVAEWVRAGAYALQEAYFQLPVSARKAWGLGLAGPSGWIALDFDFEPLSPLRLTGGADPEGDLKGWLAKNPRLERRISVVLSPKDYFRFVVSRGLAADVTSASRSDLLQPGQSHWSEEEVEKRGLRISWMPPVFDSHVPTGRLSEDGMRRTSLPGGFWLVAGAHELEAGLLASGDIRDRVLRVRTIAKGQALLAYGVAGTGPVHAPADWRRVRSGMAGWQLLERTLEASDGGESLEALEPHRKELEAAGHEVRDIGRASGTPEAGAAALAAIGSGLAKGWDHYYRKRKEE